ncbi:hypothetical protein OSB04_013900, partial [Centaurea solstitialis]
MAIAGLHKASVLDSYIGENHSPASRGCGNNRERSTTHTSSIRKMWRDLESEGRVGENGRRQVSGGVQTGNEGSCSSSLGGENMGSEDTSRRDANEIENECPQNQIMLQNRQEDNNRPCSQQSTFDVPEKERVRKIFREWGSKSFEGHTSYSSRMSNCSRSQWIGENECKRGPDRMSTQQRDGHLTGLEEPATEIGSQIEEVQDGSVDCRALLDLLKKFERERETELEDLMGNRFVSNFAHRHRIQSSLKGRFLRNQRFVEDEKQTSVAANELGLLRQTQAVSDIRYILFLSFLVQNSHTIQLQGWVLCEKWLSPLDEKWMHIRWDTRDKMPDMHRVNSLLKRYSWEGMRLKVINGLDPLLILNQLFTDPSPPTTMANVATRGAHGWVVRVKAFEQPNSMKGFLSRLNNHDHAPDGAQSDSDTSSDNDMVEQAEEIWLGGLQQSQEFATPVEERHESVELPLTVELTETRSQDLNHSVETNQNVYHTELSPGTSGSECIAHVSLPEVDEVMFSQSNAEELERHEASVRLHPLQTSTDSFNWQEVSTQAEDDDEGGWHHLTHIDSDVNLNENEHGWYQETIGSDLQESHEEWYDNTLEDTTESWFVGNSYQEAAPVGRSYAFYSSDDDNGSSRFELGELTSRRTVSNLLQSDFGARLNQLLQSYVNRQDQAYDSENELILDANPGGIEAHPSPSVIPQAESNNDLQGAADRQFPDIHQHFGTERDIINGLRIDMDMLQQRMNDMQRMLEACMGMQLQLQRSVQQEVSSALNRSSNSGGACQDGKGVCCFLCCEDGFDSSPNKSSAHMYICSKCAEKVNWSQLKESVRH